MPLPRSQKGWELSGGVGNGVNKGQVAAVIGEIAGAVTGDIQLPLSLREEDILPPQHKSL